MKKIIIKPLSKAEQAFMKLRMKTPPAYEIPTAGVKVAGFADRDGSSKEKAIVIYAKNENDGIRQEYLLLEKMFGNYEFIGQTLIHDEDKSYDMIRIKWKDRNINIWFNITGFFNKWG